MQFGVSTCSLEVGSAAATQFGRCQPLFEAGWLNEEQATASVTEGEVVSEIQPGL